MTKTSMNKSTKNKKEKKVIVCDFETTVYEGQAYTEVWAAACVELYTEEVHVFNSIDAWYEYILSLNTNVLCLFHNLKFDGEFILHYLMTKLNYKQALTETTEQIEDYTDTVYSWMDDRFMPRHSFKYSISDLGQWYTIRIQEAHAIEIWDSLKIVPFSVKAIGKAFGTKHQKTSIEYTGYREAGGIITDEEKEYISNDVLVVKEAIEKMYDEGHNKLTIGSCCLSEFKAIHPEWKEEFPDLTKIPINPLEYGASTADQYIRKAYFGGWCYGVPEKSRRVIHNGLTADVNSLYPSVMSSESGCVYPYGFPTFWKGDIPIEAKANNKYYYVRFTCRFTIKDNYLPFIQIKRNANYNGNENLTTSDILDRRTGKYCRKVKTLSGKIETIRPILTLSCTLFNLFIEHYNVEDLKILDGCYFSARAAMFDDYIYKYRAKKENAILKGDRTIAKLFLNNLYGKLAASEESSFKIAYIKPDGSLGFHTQEAKDKKPGYIAAGAAITSYAREFTIRAAQQNYYGPDKPGFIYADTDSIHADLSPEQLRGMKIHPKHFCAWKLESYWDHAIFTRQKTYIEHITHEDGEPVTPHYEIKCAGMTERSKKLFEAAITESDYSPTSPEEEAFLSTPHKLEDFVPGLELPGKLIAKRIAGGIVLHDTNYQMR